MPEAHYVIFTIDDQSFAVTISVVERVIRAVQPTHPLDAPDLIIGLINIGGDMIPLVDIRRQFGLAERPIRQSDRFIITEAAGYRTAFAADTVVGVHQLQPEPTIDPELVYPEMRRYMSGIATLENRTVLIYGIDHLISRTTMKQARQALETA